MDTRDIGRQEACSTTPDISGLVRHLRQIAGSVGFDSLGFVDVVCHKAADALKQMSAERARSVERSDEALGYATRFLESYVHRYCNPVADWKPLPDLIGVLTQIDNASTITAEILKRALTAETTLGLISNAAHKGSLTPAERLQDIRIILGRVSSPVTENTDG